MKSKWIGGLAAFMVAAMVAAPVFAQGAGGAGGAGGPGAPGGGAAGAPGAAGSPGASGTGSSPSTSGADTMKSDTSKSPKAAGKMEKSDKSHAAMGEMSGRHTMEGEVTAVDQAKGTMTLKTGEGSLNLHFPPSALANVKKGDHVAVELALKPSGRSASMGGSASPSTTTDPNLKKTDKGVSDKTPAPAEKKQ
jgi:hypothetical protein